MRAFIAVDADPPFAAPAREVQEFLRPLVGDGFRWVAPAQLHLTLWFLGEIDRAAAGPMAQAIGAAVRVVEPFPVAASAPGAFPAPGRARVLWLGVDDPSRGFDRLLLALEPALGRWGLGRESRAFVPHLTLARHRGRGADARRALAEAEPFPVSEHRVCGLALFESRLGRGGPVHVALARLRIGS